MLNFRKIFLGRLKSGFINVKNTLLEFCKPTILILCLASSIRNAAGYIWGYNYNSFYGDLNQTPEQITYYLSWIPIVGGLTGLHTKCFLQLKLRVSKIL